LCGAWIRGSSSGRDNRAPFSANLGDGDGRSDPRMGTTAHPAARSLAHGPTAGAGASRCARAHADRLPEPRPIDVQDHAWQNGRSWKAVSRTLSATRWHLEQPLRPSAGRPEGNRPIRSPNGIRTRVATLRDRKGMFAASLEIHLACSARVSCPRRVLRSAK